MQGEFCKHSNDKDILHTILTLNYSHHLQSYLHYLHSENDDESDNYSLKKDAYEI